MRPDALSRPERPQPRGGGRPEPWRPPRAFLTLEERAAVLHAAHLAIMLRRRYEAGARVGCGHAAPAPETFIARVAPFEEDRRRWARLCRVAIRLARWWEGPWDYSRSPGRD